MFWNVGPAETSWWLIRCGVFSGDRDTGCTCLHTGLRPLVVGLPLSRAGLDERRALDSIVFRNRLQKSPSEIDHFASDPPEKKEKTRFEILISLRNIARQNHTTVILSRYPQSPILSTPISCRRATQKAAVPLHSPVPEHTDTPIIPQGIMVVPHSAGPGYDI